MRRDLQSLRMCFLLLLDRVDARYPILVAANRDEAWDRPSHGPRIHPCPAGGPDILAPTDEVHGGTWIGLNGDGLFAAITNRPSAAPDPKHMVATFEQLLEGNRALASGRPDVAARAAADVVRKEPGNAFALLLEGRAALAQGQNQEAIAAFKAELDRARVPATVRLTRGRDIAAACGQLATPARAARLDAQSRRAGG